MLFRNRHGIFFSRPWSRLSRRPRARLASLIQAYPGCSGMQAQARAYEAWRRNVAA